MLKSLTSKVVSQLRSRHLEIKFSKGVDCCFNSLIKEHAHFYTKRFWPLPEGFEFPPKPNLPQVLRCWLKGQRYGNKYVKSFCQLRPKDLPTRVLQLQMRGEWQKFFKYLENNGLEMPSNTSEEVTEAQLECTTDEMWDLLENRVSYAFTRKNAKSPCLSTFAQGSYRHQKLLRMEIRQIRLTWNRGRRQNLPQDNGKIESDRWLKIQSTLDEESKKNSKCNESSKIATGNNSCRSGYLARTD
ncbi:unnamed protein product [Cylindrotheca closterium]|uniref:Uncharacterized protein n=1 Tax=Cylindrotheca closterium TaxID=2856 RepID=A0AAD2CLD5_9STRA|nr:unnamed protein product [Cylindrotheca closterium]